MTSKYIIGLTGSIATGKTTVANMLRQKGFEVIDTDRIAHKLMAKGQANYQKILAYFGPDILDDFLEIDRKKLAAIVFDRPDQLMKLNELSHPEIFGAINKRIEDSPNKLLFVEIPLLFELSMAGKLDLDLDETWLVYVDKEGQLERLKQRNKLTDQEANARINSQMPVNDKRHYADFILFNDKDIYHLHAQIKERLKDYESFR